MNIGAKVYTLSLNSAASMGDDDANLEWIREGTEVVKKSDYETALKRIIELERELESYKKDNAYLIDQLPIQKHQKYLEGLEAAAQETQKKANEFADYSYGACMEIAIAIRALKDSTGE